MSNPSDTQAVSNQGNENTILDSKKSIPDKGERRSSIAVLITLGLIFGPIFLILDLIVPSLFDWLPFDLPIFLIITIIFFGSSVIATKDNTKEF